MSMYEIPGTFLAEHKTFLFGPHGDRVYTMAQIRAPTEVRGACSGPLKARILETNHGEAFRSARAKQDNENPQKSRHLRCA